MSIFVGSATDFAGLAVTGSRVGWTPDQPTDGGVSPEHWYISAGPLWQDAGITPATADGDVVGRWEDIAASADHVNQAAGANKPTLQSGAADLLHGYPVIRFDGSDYMQGAFTNGGALAQPFTVFAVAVIDAAAAADGANRSLLDGDDGTNRMILRKRSAAPKPWAIYAGAFVDGGVVDTDWNVWTVLFNGAASRFWHNGVAESAAGNAGAHNADGITIGAQQDGGGGWIGDVTEIIIYDANLSDDDKNQVGQYLADRYGLSYTDI